MSQAHACPFSKLAMATNDELLVFTSARVLLTSQSEPCPATIEVSLLTGLITRILPIHSPRSAYPTVADTHWVDAGSHTILPGLVE